MRHIAAGLPQRHARFVYEGDDLICAEPGEVRVADQLSQVVGRGDFHVAVSR
jgi:hypothetical protein